MLDSFRLKQDESDQVGLIFNQLSANEIQVFRIGSEIYVGMARIRSD